MIHPVFVALSAGAEGGEIVFERSLRSPGHHGPHQVRKGPDRIEAHKLFGHSFDLVEEYRYEISTDQLNELAADLSSGTTRKFSLTTPEGARSTLIFGGALGKPFAAMFAACRKVRFAEEAKGTR